MRVDPSKATSQPMEGLVLVAALNVADIDPDVVGPTLTSQRYLNDLAASLQRTGDFESNGDNEFSRLWVYAALSNLVAQGGIRLHDPNIGKSTCFHHVNLSYCLP